MRATRGGQGEQQSQRSLPDAPFRSFAETSPDLFVRLDRSGRILSLSPASREMLGMSPEAAIDRHYLDFIDPEDRVQAEQSFHLLLAGAPSLTRIFRLRDRNGGRIWGEIRAVPWFDDEMLAGVQGIIRDISVRQVRQELFRHKNLALKKMSADLLATRQQLIQAERLSAIGSLAASIAHEFNNPLCGVRSVVERMARKTELAAADQGLLQLALENCDRMGRLIRDLQQFNRPCSDERKEFDLHRAIDSVLLLLNKHLKVRKAAVRREYGNEPLLLTGAEDQIKHALLNLIRKCGETLPGTGGEVRIRTGREGQNVWIVLADTGSGISEEHLPHLFEPFCTTTAAVKETGPGLSVTYGIVKAHDGEILVESPPGQGTIFTVILPAGGQDEHQGDRHVASIHSDC